MRGHSHFEALGSCDILRVSVFSASCRDFRPVAALQQSRIRLPSNRSRGTSPTKILCPRVRCAQRPWALPKATMTMAVGQTGRKWFLKPGRCPGLARGAGARGQPSIAFCRN